MEMLDIVLSFVPHYTRWDVLRYIDFQEEKTMNRTHLSVRMLCEAAVMVALAQILSYLKLMELPNGGSLTPPCFPSSCSRCAGDCPRPDGRLCVRPAPADL